MPVERTNERLDRPDEASVWLSATNDDISFAPNVTPGTFIELYAPTPNTGCDAALFPPLEGCTSTRRSGRKKPINHIPRPSNAFILFRSAIIKSQRVSAEVETNHSTLSKIIGLMWKNLPNEERQIWHARARIELDDHKRRHPLYAFKPMHSKRRAPPGQKRKVREVEPKDHIRCVKIAELLIRGKKGAELDVAVHEFDKNRVPEIVTRFEAPITANTYASSSLYKPDKRASASSLSCPIDSARESREDSYNTPSFNQHSLSPSLSLVSRSFEFTTFSFPDKSPPSSSFAETPLALAPAVTPSQLSYNPHGLVHPRPSISIPNTFRLMDEWTNSSSPISSSTSSLPTTPCQTNFSCPESYTPFTLDLQSDYTPGDPYVGHSPYPTYSSVHGLGGNEYGDIHSSLLSCGLDHKDSGSVTQEDVDFSTLMASITPYSL